MTPLLSLRSWIHSLVSSTMKTKKRRALAVFGAVASISLVAMAAVLGGWQSSTAGAMQLASIVPQGAILTIESKDFAGLLKQWSESKEKAAWLKSDDYEIFSRSRLLGRLGDAQTEFAHSAGLPPDMSFVQEVAGSDSIFAWYDVGKLEFLYITRMPAGGAERSRLFALRGKFTRRQIGSMTFYVRRTGGAAASEAPEGDSPGSDGALDVGRERTVAFATSGDWLLLATREDLMAGALTLLGRAKSTATVEAENALLPLSEEPWFHDARVAADREPGAMRMTLNLEKIVRTPYFESYWIQHNISDMKQYRCAVDDLYLEGDDLKAASDRHVFREERILLPESSTETEKISPDLTAMTALLPSHAGVYRAVASPSLDVAMSALDEKLLARAGSKFVDSRYAPVADVQVHPAGDSTDLETRIDARQLTHTTGTSELLPLREALGSADLQAMMTVSRTGELSHEPNEHGAGEHGVGDLWVPFQSAVVLSSAKDWDTARMQSALLRALAARITASDLGLAWKPVVGKAGTYLEISETRPLEIAVRGKLLVLSDDPVLMLEILGHMSPSVDRQSTSLKGKDGAATQRGAATLIAGFETRGERETFHRWTSLVDRSEGSASADGGGHTPGFFSGDMRSLGDVFSDLESERVVESRDGALIRQTVTYAWR